jgi:hypothetical protein
LFINVECRLNCTRLGKEEILTARGHRQGGGHPPRGRQIQAASLISSGSPTPRLPAQTSSLIPSSVHRNH